MSKIIVYIFLWTLAMLAASNFSFFVERVQNSLISLEKQYIMTPTIYNWALTRFNRKLNIRQPWFVISVRNQTLTCINSRDLPFPGCDVEFSKCYDLKKTTLDKYKRFTFKADAYHLFDPVLNRFVMDPSLYEAEKQLYFQTKGCNCKTQLNFHPDCRLEMTSCKTLDESYIYNEKTSFVNQIIRFYPNGTSWVTTTQTSSLSLDFTC